MNEHQTVATAAAATLASVSESSPLIELTFWGTVLLLAGLLLAGLAMTLLIWRVLLGEARIHHIHILHSRTHRMHTCHSRTHRIHT